MGPDPKRRLSGLSRPAQDLRVAVVGFPGTGKTSFLAGLHGQVGYDTSGGAHWTVEEDRPTTQHLARAWSRLKAGETQDPTVPQESPPLLQLDLRRRERKTGILWRLMGERERVTHFLHLDILDAPGAATLLSGERGGRWEKDESAPDGLGFAARIGTAEFLLFAVDSMYVLHGEDAHIQTQVNGLGQLVTEAYHYASEKGLRAVAPSDKVLAVCLCKTDAVSHLRFSSGVENGQIRQLVNILMNPQLQRTLEDKFRKVRYFAVSIFRPEQWRWNRYGACVTAGDQFLEPVGLFEPFEWIVNVKRRRDAS